MLEAPFSVSVPAEMLVAAAALNALATVRLPPVTASMSSPRTERLLIVFVPDRWVTVCAPATLMTTSSASAGQQRVGAPVRGDVPEARTADPVDDRGVGRRGGREGDGDGGDRPTRARSLERSAHGHPPPLDASDLSPASAAEGRRDLVTGALLRQAPIGGGEQRAVGRVALQEAVAERARARSAARCAAPRARPARAPSAPRRRRRSPRTPARRATRPGRSTGRPAGPARTAARDRASPRPPRAVSPARLCACARRMRAFIATPANSSASAIRSTSSQRCMRGRRDRALPASSRSTCMRTCGSAPGPSSPTAVASSDRPAVAERALDRAPRRPRGARARGRSAGARSRAPGARARTGRGRSAAAPCGSTRPRSRPAAGRERSRRCAASSRCSASS